MRSGIFYIHHSISASFLALPFSPVPILQRALPPPPLHLQSRQAQRPSQSTLQLVGGLVKRRRPFPVKLFLQHLFSKAWVFGKVVLKRIRNLVICQNLIPRRIVTTRRSFFSWNPTLDYLAVDIQCWKFMGLNVTDESFFLKYVHELPPEKF